VGFIGKNSLLITRETGSRCILAGMVIHAKEISVPIRSRSIDPIPYGCGNCTICMQQCPTGAIVSPGIVDNTTCIQGLAAQNVPVTPDIMTLWDGRLYGCRGCQDHCPYNRRTVPGVDTSIGFIGPTLSLSFVLTSSAEQLSAYFRKTVLGMRWIDLRAIQRNAIIAAGNLRAGALLPPLQCIKNSSSEVLRQTAAWAIEMIEIGSSDAKNTLQLRSRSSQL
jgi:epoxyqueuosine reductase